MPLLGGDASLFQTTVNRLDVVDGCSSPLVICNEVHRFMIASQLQELGIEPLRIILESSGRNTAPAVAVAALEALSHEDDPVLLVLPADHVIKDQDVFAHAMLTGASRAKKGDLVTFGIVPDKAATGFGYIRCVKDGRDVDVFPIAEFVEKPDRQTAEVYVNSGNFLWNSGMFMFRARVYLDQLGFFEPDIVESCRKAFDQARRDLDFLRLNPASFDVCPSDSIDYAVMEKTKNGVVVPLDAGWSDVGSWSALHGVREKDEHDNVCIGDVISHDTTHCYLHSSNRLVATVGLENHCVVETKDAVLVSPLDRVQEVKKIVERLAAQGREEALSHCKVFRPWGNYEGIDLGGRYQVKRITVYPGQVLSLQKHFHRSEHWIVVKGTALVTRGEEEIMLVEDQSTYIPLGTIHRLENPGKVNLELIEIQTGSYLGEDDIVRLEDIYGRGGENV
jgi:mannose-1-phosphate guanylyltransferase/mannose-6-phosphate isomerase